MSTDPRTEEPEPWAVPDWLLWTLVTVFGFGWVAAAVFVHWLVRQQRSWCDL